MKLLKILAVIMAVCLLGTALIACDKGGEVVRVADLTDDVAFDGAAFEKAYAAAAKKMYL